MDKEIIESTFINPDGYTLFRQIYNPIDSKIKAFVFLCHGLFEHSQSWYYESIIKPLRNVGCIILTHDHYGHGRSEGNRGMLPSIDILIRDVLLDIELTIDELKLPETVPIFIYGHSLGGLIAVHASLQKKNYFRGLILEAPALELNVNKVLIFAIKVISNMNPGFKLRKSNYDRICRNEKHLEEIKSDLFQIHFPLPAMTAQSIVSSITLVQGRFKEFDTAVIIGHGDADRLCVLKGSERFMREIVSEDKTLIVYPKARHRLRMEIDNVDVEFRQKIIDWLQERIQ